jgi:hypothetical protein
MENNNFILERSDMGDGGWSLHRAGTTDEQIVDGEGILACGEATMVDGAWDRPNDADYAAAMRDAATGREDLTAEAAREYADEQDERAHQAAHMPILTGGL